MKVIRREIANRRWHLDAVGVPQYVGGVESSAVATGQTGGEEFPLPQPYRAQPSRRRVKDR